MNGLAICAGVDGIGLGLQIANPEYRTVCYVEREAFAASVLVGLMEKGGLVPAPIWSDLATFDGGRWRGFVDIVHAGLPCQPYSVAGLKRGPDDDRHIWPDFFRVVREVQAPLVFLENVPNLLTWLQPIGTKLSALGYRFEAGIYSAEEVGAPHARQRLFLLADSERYRRGRRHYGNQAGHGGALQASGRRGRLGEEPLPDPDEGRLRFQPKRRAGPPRQAKPWHAFLKFLGTKLGDAFDAGLESRWLRRTTWPPGPRDDAEWAKVLRWSDRLAPAKPPKAKPGVRGMDYGFANRVDRLRCIGNAVVPIVAAWAFEDLKRKLAIK